MMKAQVFSEQGKCAKGDHEGGFVLVAQGKEEALCQDHLQEELSKKPELVAAVLADLLLATARPRTGQLYPRG